MTGYQSDSHSPAGAEPAPDQAPTTAPAPTGVAGLLRLALLLGLIVVLGVTRGMGAVAIVVGILVMIFLHECGHFFTAKWTGMKATEFFLGFGPRIWSFRRGETEYGLKAIPAGAYVKIIGMNNLDEVDPADEERTYRQKGFGARFLVAVAGSTMHFILALILLFVQFVAIGVPGDRTEVRSVSSGSAAEALGLREGDRIVAVNGQAVDSFLSVAKDTVSAPGDRFTLTYERSGVRNDLEVSAGGRLKVVGTRREDLDLISLGSGVFVSAPDPEGVIGRAGLRGGERVVAVAGTPVNSLDEVRTVVDGLGSGSVPLTLDGGRQVSVDLGAGVRAQGPSGFLGVGERAVLETLGPLDAVGRSFTTFGRLISDAVTGVARFVWPPNLIRLMSDAVVAPQDGQTATPMSASDAAAQAAADSEGRVMSIVGAVLFGAELSWAGMLLFLIQINIFVGVFNLIPLYPFDGGHVAVACYEKVQEWRLRRRRYLADVSRLIPVSVGVILVLAAVTILSTYRDIADPIRL